MLWQFQVNSEGTQPCTHKLSILPQTPLPSTLPHNTEQGSMCYTVGPCRLSILNIAVCTCPSPNPQLSLPCILFPGNHKLIFQVCASVRITGLFLINQVLVWIWSLKWCQPTTTEDSLEEVEVGNKPTFHFDIWTKLGMFCSAGTGTQRYTVSWRIWYSLSGREPEGSIIKSKRRWRALIHWKEDLRGRYKMLFKFSKWLSWEREIWFIILVVPKTEQKPMHRSFPDSIWGQGKTVRWNMLSSSPASPPTSASKVFCYSSSTTYWISMLIICS